MLDHTALFFGSASSAFHLSRNYPLLLIGGRKLGFKHGQYLKYGQGNQKHQSTAGIDTDAESGEQKMLSVWASGLSVQIAFGAIALTFVFYVYVGVTGGITDGFDRFDGPGEAVQQTLADPNYQPPLPPGAWTGIQ